MGPVQPKRFNVTIPSFYPICWGDSPMADANLHCDCEAMKTLLWILLAVAGVMVLSDALFDAMRKS
jgi:hypothetical protein